MFIINVVMSNVSGFYWEKNENNVVREHKIRYYATTEKLRTKAHRMKDQRIILNDDLKI